MRQDNVADKNVDEKEESVEEKHRNVYTQKACDVKYNRPKLDHKLALLILEEKRKHQDDENYLNMIKEK